MLKQLKLRKQIELKKKEQEEVRTKEEEVKKREAELERALEECENEDDMAIVEEDIEKLETEKKEVSEKKSAIEKDIEDLEKELKETEDKEKQEQEKNKKKVQEQEAETEDDERSSKKYDKERGTRKMFNVRESKYVDRLSKRERKEYVKREDVAKFLKNIRTLVEKRSITGLDLTIPTEMMELIRDNIGNYSVFYNLVNLKHVGGIARANIIAEATEAIWTEMVESINKLDYSLSQVEVDGYKVAGFVGIANSILEDSDEDLSVLVEDLLSESIAIALDKAIMFGKKNTKMPIGYVTQINEDNTLKTTNIINLTAAKTKLSEIIAAFGCIDRGVSNKGRITVVMNEKTWLKTIIPMSLATNSAGAYVSASQGVFPGTGYPVEFCNQIPEGDIHAGDYSKYLLAERRGKNVKSSTEAEFIKDITLIKATARYDGIATREKAFVVIGLNGTNATTSVTFKADKANVNVEENSDASTNE